MRIAMAQLDYTIGAFEGNLARISGAVDEARARGAHLVVFSELATTGYPPGDLLERADFVSHNLQQLDRVAAMASGNLAILVGYVDQNAAEHGKPLFNAAALCEDGAVVARYRKALLPTYDVFDEARYFEPGPPARPLEVAGVRVGVTICEDAWSDPELWDRRLYERDPVAEHAAAGAEILVNLSASPFNLGKAQQRRDLLAGHAARHRRAFVYVNQVGGNDELVFDGHSVAYDKAGRIVARARDFAEDLVVCDLPVGADGSGSPIADDGEIHAVSTSSEEEAFGALSLGLRDYLHKSGFDKVVVGLSGGIDSALVAVLATHALGPDKVLGVSMPSRYSSPGSRDDAAALAANLGIALRVIPIDGIFQAYLDGLEEVFAGLEADVTEENIQARIRGAVLMALSNKLGHLLLATGNKSELAVGYSTLYGDMCGGLSVIGDVPKTLVYRLASFANRERELIPASTLTKPPSAELRPNQTDQDSLPPYDVLDRVVEAFVEQHQTVEKMLAEGLDRDTVLEVVRLITAAEYKRRQAAPAIRISGKAFGTGRRYPIVADYASLWK